MRQALGFLCRDGSANAALLGPRYKVTFLESDEKPCSILQSRFAVAVLAKTIRCQNAASRGLGSLRRRTARVRSLPRTRKQEGSPRRRSLLAGPRRARGKHHPSADEPSRRPPTPRDPYAGRHHEGRARAGSGAAPRSGLCASFYRGGRGRNAAATPPANDAFIQLKWAAPRRNRSSSRRRPRSAIFESN